MFLCETRVFAIVENMSHLVDSSSGNTPKCSFNVSLEFTDKIRAANEIWFSKELIRPMVIFILIATNGITLYIKGYSVGTKEKKTQETLRCGPMVLHVRRVGAPSFQDYFR